MTSGACISGVEIWRKSGRPQSKCLYFYFVDRFFISRTLLAVVRSCHAHTRFTANVLLLWYRTACKYAQISLYLFLGINLNMEEHSTTALTMCWYLILDWVCVDLLQLWECTEQFSFAFIIKKPPCPRKELWSPVGRSDLLTNSDWFSQWK